jgi:mono/diheme cytochrome c family protein
MNLKIKASLLMAGIISVAGIASGADAAANWNQHCASCHAKDGSGNTTMGKKNGAKDYRDAKVQAEVTDAKAAEIIKNGVTEGGKSKMKGFKDKLSDDEIKALVSYVRAFKK